MLLTQLEYFEALARERHFGRAAASCFVTTSTLSESVRKLENELGVPLVNRGRSSFQGLTAEGELVLGYARRINTEHRRLVQDISGARGNLVGALDIGVIPSATAAAAKMLARLADAHPGVHVRLRTGKTSEQIVSGLHDHRLDAGIIHPSGVPLAGLSLHPLASVRFVAVLGRTMDQRLEASRRAEITGRELVGLPLALLDTGMRARAILDETLAEQGLTATPGAETDSAETLISLAATGRWAAVVPEMAADAFGDPSVVVRELVEPVVRMPLALARLDTDQVPSILRAVDAAAG
ncbi:LysR family transcriptional regulator [Corynebacterium nuruki]|jgi:DNA-binding transcriptional LysR family regulator|uniref:LysR family transcriptional regulator n=1 Tax=Corynebacterium nuruki TaxID=1032851 RepID=UPI0039BED7DA